MTKHRMTQRGVSALALAVLGIAPAAFAEPVAVETGDLALGLSRGEPTETLQQARNGALVGNWTALPWAQSTEFDNANGPFSHSGNLLALNFGTTGAGGSLYLYPTDGSNTGETIYTFNTSGGGIETTRVSGLSVSPDNSRLAIFGYDTGSLIILDYDPSLGGDAITGHTAWEFVSFNGATQGTTWLDNETILLYAVGSVDSELLTVNADTGDIEVVAAIPVRSIASTFTDVEYNPAIEPGFIYLSFSAFTGLTENQLTVLDASTFGEITTVLLDNSLNTAREIALGPDGDLYLGAYGGSDAPGPIIDTITGDPAGMVNDGSVDYYQAVGISSAFNGLDVALAGEPGGPTLTLTGSCPGAIVVTAEGMTPERPVAFLYARNTGSFVVPNGQRCAGTVLGLDRTVTIATTELANSQGVATVSRKVPDAACGLFLQAIDATSCETTNVEQL